MSNQIVISSGAKVRALEGVLTGTAGIVNALAINVPSGIPQLDGSGKILVSQLPNSVMEYKGSWNAATNTPTLVNGTGNAGDVYLCEVAGTVNFGAGPITFAVGDQVIYSGTIWQRASGATGTVTSVAVSRDGDALTITGSPITTSGTINIGFSGGNGQYINGEGDLVTFPSLTGFVPYTGATANVDLGNFNFDANEISGGAIIAKLNGPASSPFILKSGSSGYTIGDDAISLVSSPTTANTLILASNIGVATKTAQIGLGSLSATRTFTLPDLSGTLALLEGSQTFSGEKTFGFIKADSGVLLKNGVVPTSTGYTGIGAGIGTGIDITMSGSIYTQSLYFQTSASYIYTFPAASGTIALTSDIPSITGLVPYTGATANVNLGTFDLTADVITGATGSFASSGGSNTFTINHSSGSGIALNITKGGNGEGLYINKTSGSGNAATIIGTLNATTLVKSGGTSSQFLKADGSVDSSTYLTTGSAATTYVPYTGATSGVNLGAFDLLVNGVKVGIGGGSINSNTILGLGSLNGNTTGYGNTAIGYATLNLNTTGYDNTAIGYGSLNANTTGFNNTALGSNSLYSNTTGHSNTSGGYISLTSNTTGVANTSFGYGSLANNTTGFSNVSVGYNSMLYSNGNENTAIGNQSMQLNTTGVANVGIGHTALQKNTTGNNNIGIGYESGLNITTGSNNTIIGSYRGTAAMSNNIVLSDGQGNIRYQWDGTNNVFGNPISGTSATFSSSVTATQGAFSSAPSIGGYQVQALSNSGSSTSFGVVLVQSANGKAGYLTCGDNSASTWYGGEASFVTLGATAGAGMKFRVDASDSKGITIPTSGNVGIGITPQGIGSTKTLEIGSRGAIYDNNSNFAFVNNGWFDTIWRYKQTGTGALISTDGGDIQFSNAISGTQNSALTWNERMRITSGGIAVVGYTAGVGTIFSPPIQVKGGAGSGNGFGIISANNEMTGGIQLASSGSNSINITADPDNLRASSEIGFLVDGSQRMVITSGGIVDIAGPLVIRGTLPVDQTDAAVIDHNSNTMRIFSYGASGVTGDFQFRTAAGGAGSNLVSTINGTTGVYIAVSNINRKKDFEESNIGLNEILSLKPTLYRMKDDNELSNKELGFIAQEVKEFIPYAYVETGEDENKFIGLNYNPIVAALVKAVQELKAEIEELKSKIK
jgi:hypothetical protein